MEFNKFTVTPVGNAKLSVVDNKLKVSNISETGLDGVLIEINDLSDYTINFGNLSSIPEFQGVLKTTTLAKNPLGQVVTSFESFKWFNKETNMVKLGYNSDYLPENYNVFGKLNEKLIFDFNNSDLSGRNNGTQSKAILGIIGIIVSVIAVAVSVWKELRTKKKTTTTKNYDAKGNLTGYSVTVTEDPKPFEVLVNGEYYTVDEVGINYNLKIPSNLIGNPSVDYNTIGEQITGFNLSEFEITSIETN